MSKLHKIGDPIDLRPPRTTSYVPKGASSALDKIIAALRERGPMTVVQLAVLLGMSESGVRTAILRDIEREGGTTLRQAGFDGRQQRYAAAPVPMAGVNPVAHQPISERPLLRDYGKTLTYRGQVAR
ncbi:hypothetical protein [Comamonas antarctica]|uniref:hypothetical protein n=1 Tax=Comamonas antarctica TaxID=2743470 RepID=UPI0028EED35D|nr:hypothetical protein [Comamonas antarctica]